MAYAVITGASSGIGAVFAKELASRKKNLVLVARSIEKLQALATELRDAYKIEARAVQQDLSEQNAARRLAEWCEQEKLDVELLVNNAGFGFVGNFDGQPLENIEQMLALNAATTTKLTRLFAPKLIARGGGGILNVASIAGFTPIPEFALYAATKAFLLSLSEALNEELSPKGVAVAAVCPGFTDTPLLEKIGQSKRKTLLPIEQPEDVVKKALRALEQKRGFVITSPWYAATIFLERFLPRRLATKIARKILNYSQETKK